VSNLLPRIEFGLQSLVRRQRACPFCDGRDHRVVARKRAVFRIRRCAACHLYFTDPIYRSFVGDLYGALYNAEGSTTSVPDEETLAEWKATRFAGSDKHCAEQLQALRRLGAGRRLLEVGSSWGYFVYQAQAAGFAAVGVEPGEWRRAFGVRELGVDVRPSFDFVRETGFDVVYSAHTLEHVTDPAQFLADCRRVLRGDGILAIEVPHFDLEAMGPDVLSIMGAVHPLGLSQSFFRTALPRAGFSCVGLYDAWDAVPFSPMAAARPGNLIAIARKTRTV
jgi:SAM-dependent methyltransferase